MTLSPSQNIEVTHTLLRTKEIFSYSPLNKHFPTIFREKNKEKLQLMTKELFLIIF